MPDITQLLNRYNELANEANDRDPNNTSIEAMLKKQILELAHKGGLNGQPLWPVNEAAGKLANYGCPPDWKHCQDGSCVPPEVDCDDPPGEGLPSKA